LKIGPQGPIGRFASELARERKGCES